MGSTLWRSMIQVQLNSAELDNQAKSNRILKSTGG